LHAGIDTGAPRTAGGRTWQIGNGRCTTIFNVRTRLLPGAAKYIGAAIAGGLLRAGFARRVVAKRGLRLGVFDIGAADIR
jgi:hypothetical protein